MSKCKHLEPEASSDQSNQATSPLTAFWSDISPSQSFHLKFGFSPKSSMLIPLCGLSLPLYKAFGHSTLVCIRLLLTIARRRKSRKVVASESSMSATVWSVCKYFPLEMGENKKSIFCMLQVLKTKQSDSTKAQVLSFIPRRKVAKVCSRQTDLSRTECRRRCLQRVYPREPTQSFCLSGLHVSQRLRSNHHISAENSGK